MLLRRLVEHAESTLAEDSLPPFYQRRPVRWLLDITAGGVPLGFTDTASKESKFGVPRAVPAITRTVAVAPALAVDTAEYAFGWVFEESNPDRVPKQYEAFRKLAEEWAAAEPDGPGLSIVAFYQDGHHTTVARPEGWGRGDLVAFRVDGAVACQTPAAVRFWAGVAEGRKGSGQAGLCLVCGHTRPLLKTIPQQVPRRLLPGATNNASLVSVNEAVHGYELRKFLGHTPICAGCALSFMSALGALLASERHSLALPGQNARLAWWVVGGSTFDPMGALEQPNEADIQRMLAVPADGADTDPDEEKLSAYCSVTVGGNVARVMVRDWVEMPVPQVKRNITRWFDDHEVAEAWTGEVSRLKLSQLVRATGRWEPGRGGGKGSWTKLGGSGEDRPKGALHALWRSAVLAKPLPPGLLAHIIHRIRADGRIDQARAALVRLALRREPHRREALMPTLDLANPDAAYHCGRAFAILEDLQLAVARAAKQPLNTTFADRYLGRAILNPRSALIAGQRTAPAWLKRLRGPLRRPTWASAYQRRFDEVYEQIAERGGFPAHAVLAQQGNFVLGYHHQRAAMRAEKAAAAQGKAATDLAPTDVPDNPEGDDE
ncbi:MAG TPA: type I-C CRISPR-associated protein Cas8c/Csd1 [Micromonosporaceae bacterium]|nr:type I-C CRISPR-associated protein Cas8c/Csd1 [Micromonosporaceae bacterium]